MILDLEGSWRGSSGRPKPPTAVARSTRNLRSPGMTCFLCWNCISKNSKKTIVTTEREHSYDNSRISDIACRGTTATILRLRPTIARLSIDRQAGNLQLRLPQINPRERQNGRPERRRNSRQLLHRRKIQVLVERGGKVGERPNLHQQRTG